MSLKNSNNLDDIASSVLTKISILDSRFKVDDSKLDVTIQAWAEVLDVPHMWKLEALQAVADHYRVSEYVITPAAIVRSVNSMPYTSSRERMTGWVIDWMTRNPFANFVQTATGLDWYPDSREKIDASAEARDWLRSNLDEVVNRFMAQGWETARARAVGAPMPPSVDPFGFSAAIEG